MRILFSLALCVFFISGYSQMQIDHAIQLTGAGVNAKISGIQNVTNTNDATSVGSLQSGGFVYSDATGSNNNFQIDINPAISAYQKGMLFSFKSNQTINGPCTLNINALGAVPIKKYVNQDVGGCEIQVGQIVTVVFDSVNFQMISFPSLGSIPSAANAGPDQLNVPQNTTITLAANSPTNGTGTWSIVSGAGGNITNPSSPTSTFTGQDSVLYTLVWTISNSCGTSTDTVNLSYVACYVPGNQTFSYTGSQQTFTVPCGASSITITAYGAQGATGANTGDPSLAKTGGLGGQSTGMLAVTQGQNLYVLVGGQNGYNGGGVGGSGGGSWGAGGIGGGASDVRMGGTGLGNRIIVAGGGGGGGGQESNYYSGAGGTGGGTTGGQGDRSQGNPTYCPGASGGTQSAGGAASCWNGGSGVCGTDGSLGQGGTGANWNSFSGGGGGGGYYGGGGSSNWAGGGGGGGGSGYTGGVTNGSMQNGVQSGNGQVVITW